MYRFILSRRWLTGLIFALVAAVVCLLLARWQWDRREQRLARNHVVIENYDKPAVPLRDVIAPGAADLATSLTWTPVRVRGQYTPQATILVRNRPLDGSPGYRVLVPLTSQDDGAVLLVDRGWVPIGSTGDHPDAVPDPPQGVVDVVARLRVPEAASDRGAPAGQTQSITPRALTGQLEARGINPSTLVTGTYANLASENPSPATPLAPYPKPEIDEGPHLSYSFQWVIFALMFMAGWIMLVRRQAEDDAWEAAHGGEAPPPRRSLTASGGTADEDAEDAQLDAAYDVKPPPAAQPGPQR